MPDLLSGADFRDKDYWNRFFSSTDAFEWYGGNEELSDLILKVTSEAWRTNAKAIVNVGCGNSEAVEALERHFPNGELIDSCDYSPVAIEQMKKKYVNRRLSFTQLDVSNRGLMNHYGEDVIDFILDKGFLDAYLSMDEKHSELPKVASDYLDSCLAMLRKDGGKLMIISLAQEVILKQLMRFFMPKKNVSMELVPFTVRSKTAQQNTASGALSANTDLKLEPYALVFTVHKEAATLPYRVSCLDHDPDVTILKGLETSGKSILAGIRLIKELPRTRFIHSVSVKLNPGQRRAIEYSVPTSDVHYAISIYDSKQSKPATKKRPLMSAAVIIPDGGEYDWVFNSIGGNEVLANQLKVSRIFTVFGGSKDDSKDSTAMYNQINEDLGHLLKSLSPSSPSIPMVAVPPADVNGVKIYEDASCFVMEDGGVRSLVFNSMPRLVQSEILMGDSEGTTFMYKVPQANYQRLLLNGAFLPALMQRPAAHKNRLSIGLIGVGAGCLGMTMDALMVPVVATEKDFQNKIEEVDLERAVIDIGVKFFGLKPNATHTVECVDGVEWIAMKDKEYFDVLIVDTNGDDRSDPIGCPAPVFRTETFLANSMDAISEEGYLCINFVSREVSGLKNYVAMMKTMGFVQIDSFGREGDINKILVARKIPSPLLTKQAIKTLISNYVETYASTWTENDDIQDIEIERLI